MIWLLALAWAQPEIVVYGDRVDDARREVESRLESMGYELLKRKDGLSVYRHDAAWRGKVRIYDDGWMEIRRQGPRLRTPEDTPFSEIPAVAWMPCVTQPTACIRMGGVGIGKRKFAHVKTNTTGTVDPALRTLAERLADRSTDALMEALPDRLDALWNEGVPLEGDEPLPSHAARRWALIRYWETRTATVWGDRVAELVQAFAQHEVQTSSHPFTADELAGIEERGVTSRELIPTGPQ